MPPPTSAPPLSVRSASTIVASGRSRAAEKQTLKWGAEHVKAPSRGLTTSAENGAGGQACEQLVALGSLSWLIVQLCGVAEARLDFKGQLAGLLHCLLHVMSPPPPSPPQVPGTPLPFGGRGEFLPPPLADTCL